MSSFACFDGSPSPIICTAIHAGHDLGGKATAVKVTSGMLDLAAAVRPKLIADGMLEQKLDIREHYSPAMDNAQLATL